MWVWWHRWRQNHQYLHTQHWRWRNRWHCPHPPREPDPCPNKIVDYFIVFIGTGTYSHPMITVNGRSVNRLASLHHQRNRPNGNVHFPPKWRGFDRRNFQNIEMRPNKIFIFFFIDVWFVKEKNDIRQDKYFVSFYFLIYNIYMTII